MSIRRLTWSLSGTVSLGDELLSCCRVAIVHAVDIDAEHSLEVLGSQVQEGFDLGDAGVGDPIDKPLVSRPQRRSLRLSEWQHLHRVQGPEFFDALLDHCFDITHH